MAAGFPSELSKCTATAFQVSCLQRCEVRLYWLSSELPEVIMLRVAFEELLCLTTCFVCVVAECASHFVLAALLLCMESGVFTSPM